MEMTSVADQLLQLILSADFAAVKALLNDVIQPEHFRLIEKQFHSRDPLILAIDYKHEDIAIFLLEKGFSYQNLYTYDGRSCDQWCYHEHTTDRCPAAYDALELSRVNELPRLHSILLDIHNGVRRPGDGLASLHATRPPRPQKALPVADDVRKDFVSEGNIGIENDMSRARQHIRTYGVDYRNDNEETLMHEAVLNWSNPAMISACVNMFVPVNAQNSDGNTALHLAVQLDKPQFAKTLLSAGSDFSIRNKKGQTPLDESSGSMSELLKLYQPGLVLAVTKGHQSATQRLIRLWCHPDSNIKNGQSAMQLLASGSRSSEAIQRCHNLMQDSYKKLQLVHATLSEDIPALKTLLNSNKVCSVNIRYKGPRGWSLACYAVAQNNMDVLQLLLQCPDCNLNIRVREVDNPLCTDTIPLYFLCLSEESPTEMWKTVCQHIDYAQDSERDSAGRTALMRAIENGKSSKFIDQMIRRKFGQTLLDRNKEGVSVRAMAKQLKLDEIVQVIDKYICDHARGHFLIQMVVSFLGDELSNVKDKDGRDLKCLMSAANSTYQTAAAYSNIEAMAVELFHAAISGDLKAVSKLNNCNYRDKNGYTALIRAIVFNQSEVVELLITDRPALKSIPDNSNRYPLHYAYALAEPMSGTMVRILFARQAEDTDHTLDKDGREAADYKSLRETRGILKMLHDARTLDAYGERIARVTATDVPPQTVISAS